VPRSHGARQLILEVGSKQSDGLYAELRMEGVCCRFSSARNRKDMEKNGRTSLKEGYDG
jgi:hypothetical protein